MSVVIKKTLLGCPVTDMFHRRGRFAPKHLVQVADLDFDVINHDRFLPDGPAAGDHIPATRGQK